MLGFLWKSLPNHSANLQDHLTAAQGQLLISYLQQTFHITVHPFFRSFVYETPLVNLIYFCPSFQTFSLQKDFLSYSMIC